eukprot:563663-Rhodomonas_salina.3
MAGLSVAMLLMDEKAQCEWNPRKAPTAVNLVELVNHASNEAWSRRAQVAWVCGKVHVTFLTYTGSLLLALSFAGTQTFNGGSNSFRIRAGQNDTTNRCLMKLGVW